MTCMIIISLKYKVYVHNWFHNTAIKLHLACDPLLYNTHIKNKLSLNTIGSELVGGSVIFQCWGGRRRLTGLLSDSSSFSRRSAAFISPGSAWDGWQTTKSGHPSQGDSLEAAVILSECVRVCVSGSVCIRACWRLFVLSKHIKCGGIMLKLQ